MGTQKSNKQLQVEVRGDDAREPTVGKSGNRTATQVRRTNGHSTPAATKEAGAEPHEAKGTLSAATIATQRRISPIAFMKRFAEDMDRLFEDFEVHSGARTPRLLSRGLELFQREAGLVPVDWSPQIEVEERDEKFIVRADLPGMSKKGVKVKVREGLLTIQGERHLDAKEEHKGRYYSEFIYGTFSRSIPLPDGIDPTAVEATFHNGVIEITMPVPK